MTNVNVSAIKKEATGLERYKAAIARGYVPTYRAATNSRVLVTRWGITYSTDPYCATSRTTAPDTWHDYIWVPAWVYALFRTTGRIGLLNAAIVQEDKPALAALKKEYDALCDNPDAQLILLTTFSLDARSPDDSIGTVQKAVGAALNILQRGSL